MIRRILHFLLGHQWHGTMINRFFIETEQKCTRCGAYRHHLWQHIRFVDGIGNEPEWQDGKHPNHDRPPKRWEDLDSSVPLL